MKTRLALFAATLLLLPYVGLLLGDSAWESLALPANAPLIPLAASAFAVLCLILLGNAWATSRSGHNLFRLQGNYHLAVALASGVLGWLLVYLNQYAHSWLRLASLDTVGLLLQSGLFALLGPAVLSVRALLGTFVGWLKALARGIPVPLLTGEPAALSLLSLALIGLLGGAVRPSQLFWLFWAAPLLLLTALQLLWHEHTLFYGLGNGDWGRVVSAAVAGILVANVAMTAFVLGGGELFIQLPNIAFAQLGYALFGLLCMQLGDIIAEHWRGKTRTQVFKKKPFPIPIVVKPRNRS